MKRMGLTFALTLLAATACRAGERYALVIGVNECPQFHLEGGATARPLRGAESDADAVASALEKQFGFPAAHIELIKGPQATYEAMKAACERLRKKARRGDCVVLHYSGHGTQLPDRAPFDEAADKLDEALCLANATDAGENLLIDDELGEWLDSIEASELTVILDCCHAGTGTKDTQDDIVARYLPFPGVGKARQPQTPWRELKGSTKGLFGRRTAFFACQPREQAYERRLQEEGTPARVGQFTHYLLLGLTSGQADADGNGKVSNAEALEFARTQLDNRFNRGREPDARQQPILDSDDPDAPAIVGKLP
ncbi:MAG: caspase domain-containing protein [Pirellulales bacterium]